ncbi:hypothetical protein Micbo1qcDRAFT_169114 [Microdochium bolleyi]|uniref:NECAP PHear domain-containing protein n=1 Tax=Microdochium bolleyi TaxID=196109 RepID=A0A136ILK0_9PEZI|nr:hypothetical protein Micbo1qcDRAFT_169114 [Microdochium bolleyi]
MDTLDPATGRSLGSDAIQRVLFIANSVHVYNIPPIVPGKGHVAAGWTVDPQRQIFTSRLRIIETSVTQPNGEEKMKTDIVLEDSKTGQLFAAAPYTTQAIVENVSDSSRFFALRVQDEQGRKATLGIGFEERPEAFDFSVSLQEARKSLGLETGPPQKPGVSRTDSEEKRDLSLKEGETITVNLPGRFSRRKADTSTSSTSSGGGLSSFSLPPPPSGSAPKSGGLLPPPPSAQSVRDAKQKAATELGFDDGKFGEFS